MLEQNKILIITLIIKTLTSIFFLILVIFIITTFRSNKKFHKQQLFNDVVSREQKLKLI